MHSFHNDQATTPSTDATGAVRHSLEAMQLFAQMQCEIDEQLIDIERRKTELIQSYLEATKARLKQELLCEEEELFLPPEDIVDKETSIQQMKRKRDVDIDDETSMEQNVNKRRRLSRRMALLLSDDDDDDDDIIALSPPPLNMMDTTGLIITNHRRWSLEIDDAEILSLWKSSPIE